MKICEFIEIKPYNRGWELHHKTESNHAKSKSGYKVDVTYWPNLKKTLIACAEIMNRELLKNTSNIEEAILGIEKLKTNVSRIISDIEKANL